MNTAISRLRYSILVLLVLALAPLAARAQTFTPELTPTILGVTQGGAPASFQAAINHDPGFASSIQVKFDAATIPAGMTFTPTAQFLEPPYNPITFQVQAGATTPIGSHPVTVIFSSSTTKTATLWVYVNPSAPQPDYTLEVTPPSAPIQAGYGGEFSVRVVPSNGFAQQVTLSVPNHPDLAWLASGGVVNPGETYVFKFVVNATATAKTISQMVYGNSLSMPRKEAVVPIQILAAPDPPDFTLTFSAPSPASVAQGGKITTQLTATGVNGFNSPINVTLSPPTGVTSSMTAFVMNPGQTIPIELSTTSATPVGFAIVYVNGVSGTLTRTNSMSFEVTAGAQPDFALTVSQPVPASIRPNETAAFTVRATPSGGLTTPINVSVMAAGPVTVTPASFTLSGAAMEQVVTAKANDGAAAGAVMIQVTASSGTIQRSGSALVTVIPPVAGNAPVIDSVTPELPIPSPVQSVYLVGRNFASGATVSSLSEGVVVDPVTIFHNSGLLEVRIAVRPGTRPGAHNLQVQNPGGLTSAPARLIARSRDDIGAPLSVTTAAIVHPVDGSIISTSEDIFPQALLATTGTGTITGHWEVCNAFSAGPCLRFGDFTATVGGGMPARIKSETRVPSPWSGAEAARLKLVIDTPKTAEFASTRLIFTAERSSGFTVYSPADEAEVSGEAPRFSWTLAPGATGYLIEFVVGSGKDTRTIKFRTTESSWTPGRKDLERIGPGTHRWRVRPILAPGETLGAPTRWLKITVQATALAAAKRVAQLASAAPQEQIGLAVQTSAPTPAATTNYSFAPNVTLTNGTGQHVNGRASLSGQGELAGGAAASKFTGDLSYGANFDPSRLAQESHNWLLQGGHAPERNGGDVRLGYTSPDFTDSAEYLTSGMARIGVIGRARSKFGTFSYYQPVNTALHGVMSGNQENLGIRSAAFATPDGRKAQLRFIGLEVEEPANLEWGTPGSRVRTFGVLGRWDLSSRMALVAEIAQGKVEALDSSAGIPSRDGRALRLGVTGTVAGLSYGVNLRNTGANFVNPSNRGLTAGGVSDRLIGDLNLSRTFGRTSVNFTARRQEQGRSSESTLPDADQTGYNVSVSSSLGRVMMNLGANTTADRGEADEFSFLPATRRDQSGFNATFSETFGRFNLSQSFNFQKMRDDINSMSDQDTSSVSLNASGSLITNLTMSASLSGTRTESAPELGTTDNWTLSLQPSILMPFASLSFQPVLSITRSSNDVMDNDSKNEALQAMLQWSPSWMGSFASAQFSASWNRSAYGPSDPVTTRSYQGSLTMRLSKNKGMPLFPRTTPMPGAEVPAIAEPGSSQPVQGTPMPEVAPAEPASESDSGSGK